MNDQLGQDFEALLERSSLGSPGARLLRARTSLDEVIAARVLSQSQNGSDAETNCLPAPSRDDHHPRREAGEGAQAEGEPTASALTGDSTGGGVCLTVAEVASVMRVSKMTVYRLVHAGALPTIRAGRSFRVPERAVHDYLASYSSTSPCGRLFGHDHPDTLTVRINLAIAYNDAGRAQEALVLWERVLADSERLFGHDHPDTLTACNNLAIAYNDAGRAQEALVLWERVLADSERLFGHDHPDTLTACNNLAQVRQHSGSVRLSNTATNNNRT